MNIKRGAIYWADIHSEVEHINNGKRPVLVVSNDKCNEHSSIVHVVPLTTAIKKDIPTHISFIIKGIYNTALCEQILPLNAFELRVCNFITQLSKREMDGISLAIMKQLGIMEV